MKINRFLKGVIGLCIAVTLAASLWSCGGDESDFCGEGFAARFDGDDSWSLVKENGDVIIRDYFDGSSDGVRGLVLSGMFVVKSSDGYYVYSVDNPKKALNKDPFLEVTDYAGDYAYATRQGTAILMVNKNGAVVRVLDDKIVKVTAIPSADRVIYRTDEGESGLLDGSGDVKVKAKWADIFYAGDGMFVAVDKDDHKSLINADGEVKLTLKGDDNFMLKMHNGWIAVNNSDKKSRFVNRKGEEELSLKRNLYGYVRVGDAVLCRQQDSDSGAPYQLIEAKEDGEVLARGIQDVLPLPGELFAYMKNDKLGIMDSKGDKVEFDEDYNGLAGMFRSSLLLADKNDHYYLADVNSHKILNKDDIDAFSVTANATVESEKAPNSFVVENILKAVKSDAVTINGVNVSVLTSVEDVLKAVDKTMQQAYYASRGPGSSYEFSDSENNIFGRVIFNTDPVRFSYSYDPWMFSGSSNYVENINARVEAVVIGVSLERPIATMRAISLALCTKGFSTDGDDFSLVAGDNHIYLRRCPSGFYLAYTFGVSAQI